MQAENWKNIKGILLEALKLDPARRRDYLERADLTAETRLEVESLLGLEAEAEDFMSLTVGDFSRDFFAHDVTDVNPIINQKIGIYEIVSELGFGGMGAVYLAIRADGKFEQQVAIKMLKREFNTEKIRRIFQREKEILATLSHPNIATLLDAGTTADGIPYLVMEHIKGEPIDSYCQRRKLTLNFRLKLFNKVCEAVAFAHRNLIIHRDLKPSNILVTADGEPKLLDFGISKLLDAQAEDAVNITHLGALTPQYASPEQIKGEPVTTATDVYSLGVVLFKILTESFPYHVGNKTNGNLLREITESAPRLPSDAATQRRSDTTTINSSRDGNSYPSPARCVAASELRGDLDNILLKALRKEPERRYQTVEQFCADIWRFVDGMPVLARPATFSYRASKFYGRNKVSVLAAALILVSLFAGIAVALSQAKAARAQAHLAAEARRQAELETERARAEKQKAERTSRFMQSFLDYANPNWYGRGKGRTNVTVREAIDDAATRIDTELADEPEVRADLHYTIGEVYSAQDESKLALEHFRQSLDLYRQVHGERHPKVARGIYYVSLFEPNIEGAEPLLRQGIAMMRETEPDNVNLPYMLQSLASWVRPGKQQNKNEHRLAEAESLLLEAKTLFKRHYDENHLASISAASNLAALALSVAIWRGRKEMQEEVLRRYRQADEGGDGYIWALFYLAETRLAMGKAMEAETLFRQASQSGRRLWGANDLRFEELHRSITEAHAAAHK